jgi:glycosyltransferase involved in cell wall biosynthesis
LHDWLRGVLAKPDLLVTPSAACRERFVGFGVAPDHVRVALQGQDHAPFVGVQRSPSDRLRVGFVGTLIPSKGTHLIVEAFDRLPAGSASLLLAGNCPPFYQVTDYGDRIRELVASVLAENPVELLGTYAHSDLPALLGRIDVLVVPPLWHEVFGLTLREGMLAGCAVVASQVGGLTDGIEEGVNGFTFPAGDVDALAGILQRFVDEPGLAARLGGAPSNVRRVEDLARELCGVYAEVGAVM